MKKQRTTLPNSEAARVLFEHDRTCCVCRRLGRPVQVHHIDDDPSNNATVNLAVLCLECHRETQIRGGFDRKLDADQVSLYRDDWCSVVRAQRVRTDKRLEFQRITDHARLALITSLAEIYSEGREYELLAILYRDIGNKELCDKYISLALPDAVSDSDVIWLRRIQDRLDLVPEEAIRRELDRNAAAGRWNMCALILKQLGRHREAVSSYARTILQSLEEDNPFSAAFYLKDLCESGLLQKQLLVEALEQGRQAGELWLQVRALQELGWEHELCGLLLQREREIQESQNLQLQALLADAQGDKDRADSIRKEMARNSIPVRI